MIYPTGNLRSMYKNIIHGILYRGKKFYLWQISPLSQYLITAKGGIKDFLTLKLVKGLDRVKNIRDSV